MTLGLGLLFLAAAAWAGWLDWAGEIERDSAALDFLATSYKIIGLATLSWMGYRLESRSMYLLALLLAALVIAHLLVHADWFSRLARVVADPLSEALPLSSGKIQLGGMFMALGIVGGALLWATIRTVRPFERPVVMVLVWMLVVVGIFTGPVNAISSLGINREWLFAEDFGQVVSLAVLAAYGVGLVISTGRRSTTLA